MKNRNLITLMLILTSAFSYGQKLALNTTVRAKRNAFKVEEIKRDNVASNNMVVRNTANIYYSRKSNISANDIALYEKIQKRKYAKKA